MAEQKTKQSVENFLNRVADEAVRDDCYTLMDRMRTILFYPLRFDCTPFYDSSVFM